MRGRGRWIRLAVIAVLLLLILGRWLADRTADAAWAQALGVGAAHAAMRDLRLYLVLLAFVAAAVWCTGNLYLVYRSIGSVHVPRRLGNLEIIETVPRRYLLIGAVGIGLILAFALSTGASAWWMRRALIGASGPAGLKDPLLQRDLSYYLFRLPWERELHRFVTLLAGVITVLVVLLYMAVGAVRWKQHRLEVTDLARMHLAGLLAVFALALFWGYRLEPAEYIAGVHGVPYDRVLADVRLPVARILSAIALGVALVSTLWVRTTRAGLVAGAWIVLAVASFIGHYVAPGLAAVRTPGERGAGAFAEAATELRGWAYGLDGDTVITPPATPAAGQARRHMADLTDTPIWDPFAITEVLNRTAATGPYDRFFEATLTAYPDQAGEQVPVYLAVRELDLASAGKNDRTLTWERVRRGPLSHSAGVLAVSASRASANGLPLFLASLTRPDSASSAVHDLAIGAVPPTAADDTAPAVWFAPAIGGYALADSGEGPTAAVPAAGLWRRLALAWALQSPALVTSNAIQPSTLVLWDRTISARLARFAPFARFGAAYPAVVGRRLVWLAAGYVWGDAFPLATPVAWRGRTVRYLRVGMIGEVDATSGRTRVYLLPDADPVSRAWARLAPEIVQPFDSLPLEARRAIRYPEELFQAQLSVLRRTDPRYADSTPATHAPEPFWWFGAAPGDPVRRVRLREVIEVGKHLAGIVDGSADAGVFRLRAMAVAGVQQMPAANDVAREFAGGVDPQAAIPGPLKVTPFSDGIVAVQSYYTEPNPSESAPRLADLAVGWRGEVGHGPTVAAALGRVRRAGPEGATAGPWAEARAWFRRLDAARVAGDWTAFGKAYEQLRRLLDTAADSTP